MVSARVLKGARLSKETSCLQATGSQKPSPYRPAVGLRPSQRRLAPTPGDKRPGFRRLAPSQVREWRLGAPASVTRLLVFPPGNVIQFLPHLRRVPEFVQEPIHRAKFPGVPKVYHSRHLDARFGVKWTPLLRERIAPPPRPLAAAAPSPAFALGDLRCKPLLLPRRLAPGALARLLSLRLPSRLQPAPPATSLWPPSVPSACGGRAASRGPVQAPGRSQGLRYHCKRLRPNRNTTLACSTGHRTPSLASHAMASGCQPRTP